jgi:tetratricopeptide (TPR) repeat protein
MGRSASTSRRAPSSGATSSHRQVFLLVLRVAILLEAGAWAFGPVLNGSWIGDDTLYLTRNALLYDPHRIWKAWFEPGSFIDYYPIEQTVQWFQWRLFGLDSPYPYLVCNLVLHLTSALLIWRLFARLGLKWAWVGSLLFVLHPTLVDTIGTSNELKSTLSLPPFLLAMLFYLDFDESGKPRAYFAALSLFLVAMLCKLTMAFFPVIILVYAWWKRGRVVWPDFRAALPFFAISLTLGIFFIHASALNAASTHYLSPGVMPMLDPLHRLALAGLSLAFYFGHAFLPLGTRPLYPQWSLEPLSPAFLMPWLGGGVVLAVCYARRASWGRAAVFGLGFFALGLLPFLGLNEVSYMCLGWVFDHFLYIPLIGLIGLVVAALENSTALLPVRVKPVAIAVVALALGWLGWQTHSYAKIFADQSKLWAYTVKLTPDTWFGRYNDAVALSEQNKIDEALTQVTESLRLNPDFDNGHFTQGLLLCQEGEYPEAIAALQECLRINPHYGAAHLFIGIADTRLGQPDEAIREIGLLLQVAPNNPKAHVALANALALDNRVPEAIAELETAQRLAPEDETIQPQLDAWRKMQAGTSGK